MSRKQNRPSLTHLFAGLGWPVIGGLAACSVFYVLIVQGPLNTPLMHRYFAGHPVSYTETAMFFVGLAALIIKLWDVVGQHLRMPSLSLAAPQSHDPSDAAQELLASLDQTSAAGAESYLVRRFRDALHHVQRKGSGVGLDAELKYLSDLDAARQHDSYGLVRIMIWAIPMLGFLGTVAGITQALGDLDPKQLAESIQTAMDGFLAGLYVAFDTTAVALSLSIGLMFLQFVVDRLEIRLLEGVDQRVAHELLERFRDNGFRADPHLIAVERMSMAVARTTEQLVRQQTELWRRTIDESNQQWTKMLKQSGGELRETLAASLDQSLQQHAQRLGAIAQQTDELVKKRWDAWQAALQDSAKLLHGQQTALVRQGEVLQQVLQATGEVVSLETALNDNLAALSGAKNFEDTVMSLSAAIHLLNARLGHVPDRQRPVEIVREPQSGRAA